MFAAIAEIALHTPLTFTVTREADRLHVIIAGKGDKPLAFATPVRVTGTPAELDEQLPAQLVAYAAQMVTPTTAIALPAPDAGAPAKKMTTPRTVATKSPPKAKKPAPKVTSAPKKPAAPKTPPAARTGRKQEQPRRAEKALTPRKDGAESTLPGKPECIADLHALQAKHGAKLTRRIFIKEAPTGRRYEKLWKNFEAFAAEAAPAAPDLFTQPATTTRVALDSAAPWPFPVPEEGAERPTLPEDLRDDNPGRYYAEDLAEIDSERATARAAQPPEPKPRVVGPMAGARTLNEALNDALAGAVHTTTEATE